MGRLANIRSLVFAMSAFALTAASSRAAEVDPDLIPNIFKPESTPAHSINFLSFFCLMICSAIFIIVCAMMVYACIRFRRRADDDDSEPPQVYGSNPLEAAWTIVPILIVVVLALTTARIIQDVQNAPKPASAVDVQVIGHQWWWEIRYPKLGIVTANELHVPVSYAQKRLPTFLDLRSADVAHSFWVPKLAGKTDLIPNRVNEMWIEPHRAGLFLGQCAEYCGTQHAKMLLRVYAHEPADFDKWVKQQQATQTSDPENSFRVDHLKGNEDKPVWAEIVDPKIAAGARVFQKTACVNCHVLNDPIAQRKFGPDLTHLMSRKTLGSGAVENTPENLRAWIKDPHHFKPGVLMPAMSMSEKDLDDLTAYLATMK